MIAAACDRTLRPPERGAVHPLEPGALIAATGADWDCFVESWNHLPRDRWMADGGRYRRRRYAAFDLTPAQCRRLPHRAHFQERDHNPLNGGVARWFAPVRHDPATAILLERLIRATATRIATIDPAAPCHWSVEAHQFRIAAQPGQPGMPTPEGMHRDGRDWVLILWIGGSNYAGGASSIVDQAGAPRLTHRLSRPGEALLLDDHRVRHATAPITPIDETRPAWRDTLVLTFASAARG